MRFFSYATYPPTEYLAPAEFRLFLFQRLPSISANFEGYLLRFYKIAPANIRLVL